MNNNSNKASRPGYIPIGDGVDSTPTGSLNGSGGTENSIGYLRVEDDSLNEVGLMFIRDGEVGDGRALEESIEQSMERILEQSMEIAIEQYINDSVDENMDGNVDQRHQYKLDATRDQSANSQPDITSTGATQASMRPLGTSKTGGELTDNSVGQSTATTRRRTNRRQRTFSNQICPCSDGASRDCSGQGHDHCNFGTDTSTGESTTTTISGHVNRKERTFPGQNGQSGFNSDSENRVIASTSSTNERVPRLLKPFAEPYDGESEDKNKLIENDVKEGCCISPCCRNCTIL